jgi:hypothetical protein
MRQVLVMFLLKWGSYAGANLVQVYRLIVVIFLILMNNLPQMAIAMLNYRNVRCVERWGQDKLIGADIPYFAACKGLSKYRT